MTVFFETNFSSCVAAGAAISLLVESNLFLTSGGTLPATISPVVVLLVEVGLATCVLSTRVLSARVLVASVVTFPSAARSGVDFTLYLSLLRFFGSGSVTPVRGREDTDGDGNTGVVIQVSWSDCS